MGRVARQAPLFMGFPQQEYWSGLPLPFPGDLPDLGIEPTSPALIDWQRARYKSARGNHAGFQVQHRNHLAIAANGQYRKVFDFFPVLLVCLIL